MIPSERKWLMGAVDDAQAGEHISTGHGSDLHAADGTWVLENQQRQMGTMENNSGRSCTAQGDLRKNKGTWRVPRSR